LYFYLCGAIFGYGILFNLKSKYIFNPDWENANYGTGKFTYDTKNCDIGSQEWRKVTYK
jgi:hypothetical protein